MQPHIRRSQFVIAILAAMVSLPPVAGRADTMLWINDSDSNAGTPGIGVLNPRGSTAYLWGRPDGDETLLNLSLNLVSDSAAVSLTGVSVVNPVISPGIGFHAKAFVRHEFDSPGDIAADAITGFRGFTVTSAKRIGVGMGPLTGAGAPNFFQDPNYDAVNDAFLIASFDYSVAGDAGDAGLWLQIGAFGLNNAGGRSEDVNVVFGNPNDPALNGEAGREQNSATADAIFYIPEPSTLLLAGLTVVALVGRRLACPQARLPRSMVPVPRPEDPRTAAVGVVGSSGGTLEIRDGRRESGHWDGRAFFGQGVR
ncbi:MAG: PEP-CTERM sorting domain-containing protein [Pirellulales bacterium]